MDCRLYQKIVTALVLLIAAPQHNALQAQTMEQWRDSLIVLSRAITQNPQSVDLRLRKAAVNLELSQWAYAVDEYGRVLELDAKNLTALFFRAYAHNQLRHYDQAVADYDKLLSLVPKHFEGLFGASMANRKAGNTVKAMDYLNQMVQFFPDSALAYAARASYEAELKMYDAALFDWDEAISRDSDNVDIAVSKVDLLLKLDRKREARRLLRSIIDKGVPRAALKEWLERSE